MFTKLGTVVHKTHNGYILVKLSLEKLPRLNTAVYTRDGRRIGVLFDIIGPVREPYGVVKPDVKDVSMSSGLEVYYREPRMVERRGKGTRKQRSTRRHGRGSTEGQPRGSRKREG